MNRQSFLKLVENPSLLSSDTVAGLASIVADYPFFQAGRMLYVKNLSVVDSLKYNSALKNSAAYIEHRDKLYDLIHQYQNVTLVENVPIVAQEVILEDTIEPHIEPVLLSKDELVAKPEVIVDYFEVSSELDLSSFTPLHKLPEVDKQVVDIPESFIEVPAMSYPSVDLLDFEKGDDSGYSLEAVAHEPDGALTFSDWLIKMRQTKAVDILPKVETTEKMDLINNFLKNKPKRIIPKLVDVTDGARVSKRDFDEPEGLLTETLANIYIKQKHYDKSIKIFEKLSLKYPEKSIYFANRIVEVEKLNNNNL